MEQLSATLVVFGLTIDAVLSDPQWTSTPRDLDCVEVFSGMGAVTMAARGAGKRAQPFDILRDMRENMATANGFRRSVLLVMRLVVGGLLWLAPVCSTWVFMNSSNCQRKKKNKYYGNKSYKPVQQGNIMARASAFLILLAAQRCVQAAVENPVGSCIFKFPPLQRVLAALCMVRAITYRCAFSTEPYGERMRKPFEFWATGTWIQDTAEACTCPNNVHKQLVIRYWRAGRWRTKGIKSALSASGAYPEGLGRRIVQSWLHATSGSAPSSSHTKPQKFWATPSGAGAFTSSAEPGGAVQPIVFSVQRPVSMPNVQAPAVNTQVTTRRAWATPSAGDQPSMSSPMLVRPPAVRAWAHPSP